MPPAPAFCGLRMNINLLFWFTIRRQYALNPPPKVEKSGPVRGRPMEKIRMAGPLNPKSGRPGATRRTAVGLILGAPLLGACSGVQQSLSSFSNPFIPEPSGPPQQPQAVGRGQVKVGLILPLSAAGNAGVAAQS